jgi:membrane associated rhomboid family serine protease
LIPFRDNIQSHTFPIVTITLIVINSGVFFYELTLGRNLQPFLYEYGVVPINVFHWPGSDQTLSSIAMPYFTSMFLHGGWFHLIGNMWYLWIFGDNVEDRLGHGRFVMFYLLAGLGASVVHTGVNSNVPIPTVGASGAIAGVLGAYLILYPFARVLTIIPFFVFWPIIEIPAVIVLGSWFLMQFLSGAGSLAQSGPSAGGVAWWAHIGGFVIGMLLLGVFRRRPGSDSPRARPSFS